MADFSPEDIAFAEKHQKEIDEAISKQQRLITSDEVDAFKRSSDLFKNQYSDSAGGRAIARGFLDTGSGLAGLGEVITDVTGLPGKETFKELGDKAEDLRRVIPTEMKSFRDVKSVKDAGVYIAETLGEMAPQIALSALAGLGLLGRVGKLAQVAGTAAPAAAQEIGSNYREIRDTTGQERPGIAITTGSAAGLLEALPINRFIGKVFGEATDEVKEQSWRQLMSKVFAEVPKQAGIEGVTEGAQETLSMLGSKWADSTYQLVTPDNWQRVLEAGVKGLVGGGVMGAASGAVQAETSFPAVEEQPDADLRQMDEDALLGAMRQSTIIDRGPAPQLPPETPTINPQNISTPRDEAIQRIVQQVENMQAPKAAQPTGAPAAAQAVAGITPESLRRQDMGRQISRTMEDVQFAPVSKAAQPEPPALPNPDVIEENLSALRAPKRPTQSTEAPPRQAIPPAEPPTASTSEQTAAPRDSFKLQITGKLDVTRMPAEFKVTNKGEPAPAVIAVNRSGKVILGVNKGVTFLKAYDLKPEFQSQVRKIRPGIYELPDSIRSNPAAWERPEGRTALRGDAKSIFIEGQTREQVKDEAKDNTANLVEVFASIDPALAEAAQSMTPEQLDSIRANLDAILLAKTARANTMTARELGQVITGKASALSKKLIEKFKADAEAWIAEVAESDPRGAREDRKLLREQVKEIEAAVQLNEQGVPANPATFFALLSDSLSTRGRYADASIASEGEAPLMGQVTQAELESAKRESSSSLITPGDTERLLERAEMQDAARWLEAYQSNPTAELRQAYLSAFTKGLKALNANGVEISDDAASDLGDAVLETALGSTQARPDGGNAMAALNAFLSTPAGRYLTGVQVVQSDGQMRAQFLPASRVIGLSQLADSNDAIHEAFHAIEPVLPEADRNEIRAARLKAIAGLTGEVKQALEKGMTSQQFIDSGLPGEVYHLINDSEFFAWSMTNLAGDRFTPGFKAKMKALIADLWRALKSVFGMSTSAENTFRAILSGQYEVTPQGGQLFEADVHGSYVKSAEKAKQYAEAARTQAATEFEADSFMAQSADLVDIFTRLGLGKASNRAKQMLGTFNYGAILDVAKSVATGPVLTYRQLKAKHANSEHRLNHFAKNASRHLADFDHRARSVISAYDQKLKEWGSMRSRRLRVKESVASAKVDAARQLRDQSRSMFLAAYKKAQEALNTVSNNDLEMARLRGEMKALKEASESEAAVEQIVTDMAAVLTADPTGRGLDLLTRDASGDWKALLAHYKQLKGATPHNASLLDWSAWVLAHARELASDLAAANLASIPNVVTQMNLFEKSALMALDSDPVRFHRNELRRAGKLGSDAEKARFAWSRLNKQLKAQLKTLDEFEEASAIAADILGDRDFQELYGEVMRDAKVIGTKEPIGVASETVVTLPDGTTLDLSARDSLVGNSIEFSKKRAEIMDSIVKLENWIYDPANENHIDWELHRLNMEMLKNLYAGSAVLHPPDMVGVRGAFDILENLLDDIGGRVAAAVRPLVRNFAQLARKGSEWIKEASPQFTITRLDAIKSHGFDSKRDQIAANKMWWLEVGQELSASWRNPAGGLQVGDRLTSGQVVTAEDMAHLRVQDKMVNKAYELVRRTAKGMRGLASYKGQMTEDAVGNVKLFREALKETELMLPRTLDYTLQKFVKDYNAAARRGDTAAIIKLLNDHPRAMVAMFTDRNPDFANPTVLDGPGGAFDLLAQGVRNGQLTPQTFDDFIAELERLTGMPQVEISEIALKEFASIIERLNRVFADDPASVPIRPAGAQNSFTEAGGTAIGPWVFQTVGFRDSTTLAGFGSNISTPAMDEVIRGFEAIQADLIRQQEEARIEMEKLGKNEAIASNEQAAKKGETYDRWRDLDSRMRQASRVLQALQINPGHYDVESLFTRATRLLTGGLIGTFAATARNLFTGPLFLWRMAVEQFGMSMPKAGLYAVFGGLRSQVLIGALFVRAATKMAAVGAPRGLYGAAKVLLTKGNDKALRAFGKLSHELVEPFVKSMYWDLPAIKDLHDRGVIHVPDYVAENDARFMSPMHQGRIPDERAEYSMLSAPFHGIISALELAFHGTGLSAAHPVIGDLGLNMEIHWLMKSKMGPIMNVQRRLAKLHSDLRRGNMLSRFDLANPRAAKNRLSPHEVMPIGSRDETALANLERIFQKAGLDFHVKAVEYIAALEAGQTDASLLSRDEMDRLAEAAIDFANRGNSANTPLWMRSKNFFARLASPLMGWPIRTTANFWRNLRISRKDTKNRALMWTVLATKVAAILMVSALFGVGAEEENRLMSKFIYGQERSTRQPWEDEEHPHMAWLAASTANIPFVDMLITAIGVDMPTRGRQTASLVMIDKAKDILGYIGGVAQTGDPSYGFTKLATSLLPDSRIGLRALGIDDGVREVASASALIRRHGPQSNLREMNYVSSTGQRVNPVAPYARRIVNAVLAKDYGEAIRLKAEAMQAAQAAGVADPERSVEQAISWRLDPFKRTLQSPLSPEQERAMLQSMSPADRKYVEGMQERIAGGMTAMGFREPRFTREASSAPRSTARGRTLSSRLRLRRRRASARYGSRTRRALKLRKRRR